MGEYAGGLPGTPIKRVSYCVKESRRGSQFVANELINEDTKTSHDKKLLLF